VIRRYELSNAEWVTLQRFLPSVVTGGRPRSDDCLTIYRNVPARFSDDYRTAAASGKHPGLAEHPLSAPRRAGVRHLAGARAHRLALAVREPAVATTLVAQYATDVDHNALPAVRAAVRHAAGLLAGDPAAVYEAAALVRGVGLVL
jgi:hypothetical protein